MGGSAITIAIGEQMREAAEALAGKDRRAVPPVRPSHRAARQRRLPAVAFRTGARTRFRSNTAASAASWWTPCSTPISSAAARRSPSAPNPTCCGRSAGCRDLGCEIEAAVTTTHSPAAGAAAGGRSADRRPGRPREQRAGGLRPDGHPHRTAASRRAARHSAVPRMGLPDVRPPRRGAPAVRGLSRHARPDFRSGQHFHATACTIARAGRLAPATRGAMRVRRLRLISSGAKGTDGEPQNKGQAA